MNPRDRRTRSVLILGGLAVWGLLLVACNVIVDRPLFLPPQIAGAKFVGTKECKECHAPISASFRNATHSRMMAPGENAKNVGCESCHGPGSQHIQSGGALGSIVNPRHSPSQCFACHLDKRGEFSLPHAHPVMAGKVSCGDCHNPHVGDAVIGGGTSRASANETCLKCHSSQSGPFVFEHEALRENCTTCHNPHGTVNDKMLKARNATLCLQCHFQQQTITGQLLIGGRDHAASLQRGTCWTAGCHEAIHGSHVNSSLRF